MLRQPLEGLCQPPGESLPSIVQELNSLPKSSFYNTFSDLDVLDMMIAPNSDFISIESYANLFAVLYNVGYLSAPMSQYALDLLSQSTFHEGIVSGVPSGVRVAHKFGHRVLSNQDQLHDCGIVYHPSTVYLLCIMTTGADYEREKKSVAALSSVVYSFIDSHRKN